MTYCINPECKHRQNPDNLECCQACGTPLIIHDRYRLIRPLRSLELRNYTEIFEVTDGKTRKVMKVLKDDRPKLVNLLEKEAFTLQWLNHPGIPKVDADGYLTFKANDSSHKIYCLVMEKIEGQNLETWVNQNGAISQAQALKWLRQLLEILYYVHQNGFFHRDIKPSNIIVKPNDQLVIIDFGAAREMTDTYFAKISVGFEGKINRDITQIVSANYTPLEQVNGRAVPQSDFYALGRTFVRLLTGKSLDEFPINNTGQLIWRDKAPQVSKPLADFIDDLMAPFPGERPQNAQIALQQAKAMWLHSIWRIVNSPKNRRIIVMFVLGLITVPLLYRLTFPLQAQYYSERGRKALQSEDWDEARKNLEQAIARNPNDPILHDNLGLACQELKDITCAITQYQKALNLNSDAETVANIQYNIGSLSEKIGDYNTALKKYEAAMQDNGDIGVDATIQFARLQIWHKRDYDIAISDLTKIIGRVKDQSSQSTLYKNLGWAYLQKGNYRHAEKYLQQAINLDKDRRAAPHCLLARLLQVKGNKTGEKAAWKNCLYYNSEDFPEVKAWQLDAELYLKAEEQKP